MVDTYCHELSHIVNESPDHDNDWVDLYTYLCSEIHLSGEHFRNDIGNIYIGNIAWNIGNISGIQNLLVDYHLLLSFRKFSQRVLGTEGQWRYTKSTAVPGGDTIRLYPAPKSSFPVIIEYVPSVSEFKSAQARELTYRAVLAQMKIALGSARRKFGGIPSPDGSNIQFDGESLVREGTEEYEKIVEFAINQSEPLGPFLW